MRQNNVRNAQGFTKRLQHKTLTLNFETMQFEGIKFLLWLMGAIRWETRPPHFFRLGI